MKKHYTMSLLLLAALSVSAIAHTAGAQEEDVRRTKSKSKRVVKYNEATNEVVDVPTQPEGTPPVYIVNSPKYENGGQQQTVTTTQATVQEQPTTVIEASSLRESRSDQLRKSRQDMEVQTEQKIVEKLEEARIQDEKARADRLFGNSLAAPVVAATPAPTPAPQIAPPPLAPQAQYQAPAPVSSSVIVVEKEEKTDERADDSAAIKEEVKRALDEAKSEQKEDKPSYYIGGVLGVSEYPDARNVRGNGSGGFSIGTITPEGWVAEGSFLYSGYDLEVITPYYTSAFPPFKAVTQYNAELGAKYMFSLGKLRPSVGILGSYAYRKYKDKQYAYVAAADASTNAFDMGLSAGLDLMITKSFAIGFEAKYLTNIAYRSDANYQQSFTSPQFQQQGTPLEKIDYYSATVTGKVLF
jgi:hypothetical protein